MQWTKLVAAELVAITVNVDEDVVAAVVADDLVGRPTRDGFGSTILEEDFAVSIGNVGALGQRVEDLVTAEVFQRLGR